MPLQRARARAHPRRQALSEEEEDADWMKRTRAPRAPRQTEGEEKTKFTVATADTDAALSLSDAFWRMKTAGFLGIQSL